MTNDDPSGTSAELLPAGPQLDDDLIDVSELASRAGFTMPVALTRAAWEDLVEWTAADESRKPTPTGQSREARLWDVLTMAGLGARRRSGGDGLIYRVRRVPRQGSGVDPADAFPVLQMAPDADGRLAVTISVATEA